MRTSAETGQIVESQIGTESRTVEAPVSPSKARANTPPTIEAVKTASNVRMGCRLDRSPLDLFMGSLIQEILSNNMSKRNTDVNDSDSGRETCNSLTSDVSEGRDDRDNDLMIELVQDNARSTAAPKACPSLYSSSTRSSRWETTSCSASAPSTLINNRRMENNGNPVENLPKRPRRSASLSPVRQRGRSSSISPRRHRTSSPCRADLLNRHYRQHHHRNNNMHRGDQAPKIPMKNDKSRITSNVSRTRHQYYDTNFVMGSCTHSNEHTINQNTCETIANEETPFLSQDQILREKGSCSNEDVRTKNGTMHNDNCDNSTSITEKPNCLSQDEMLLLEPDEIHDNDGNSKDADTNTEIYMCFDDFNHSWPRLTNARLPTHVQNEQVLLDLPRFPQRAPSFDTKDFDGLSLENQD